MSSRISKEQSVLSAHVEEKKNIKELLERLLGHKEDIDEIMNELDELEEEYNQKV